MNLKLVAVSMSVLGLISSPVLADTTHKHKHHKKSHHHVAHHHDYKAMGALPVQRATVETSAPVAAYSMTSTIIDQMSQNTGTVKPMPEWFNRIGVSGGINFDTGKWGSRSTANPAFMGTTAIPAPFTRAVGGSSGYNNAKQGYAGENTMRFSMNDVFLNVSADVYEYAKAFASLAYTDVSSNYSNAYTTGLSETNANYGSLNQHLTIEQAYVRLSNFDCSPFFFSFGKQFQDFGRYTLHPITRSMDQVLSETLRNSVNLGFITDVGVHGSVYGFQNGVYRSTDSNNQENSLNVGAAVGYAHPDDQFGYDLGAGYMYNMFGVNDIAAMVAGTTGTAGAPGVYAGYHNRPSAVAAYADMNFEAFSLGARYVTATSRFSSLDAPQNLLHTGNGARPWALGLNAGYGFNAWSKNQNVYLGFQTSQNTAYFNLPHVRTLVGYGVDVYKNTNLSAELDHDNAWSLSDGGPGGSSNLISVRAAVKFG